MPVVVWLGDRKGIKPIKLTRVFKTEKPRFFKAENLGF